MQNYLISANTKKSGNCNETHSRTIHRYYIIQTLQIDTINFVLTTQKKNNIKSKYLNSI